MEAERYISESCPAVFSPPVAEGSRTAQRRFMVLQERTVLPEESGWKSGC